MMQENCQEFPSGMPKRAMPIRESNRDGKTGVLACLGKQASSLFLNLPSLEDRRPRLSRQTGFQPVSSPATLGRQASPPVCPAKRWSRQTGFQPVSYLPIRFEMPNNRITHYHDGEYNDPGEVFPQIQGRPQICILLPSVLPESLRFFTSVKSG